MSPPPAPTGINAYQVNLNRTKTKKWVEAKVQSYDGDDWGADEYDDEDEPTPAPAPAAVKPAVRTTGSRNSSLPSLRTQQPSAGSEVLRKQVQASPYLAPDPKYGSRASDGRLRPTEESAVAGHDNIDAVARSPPVLGLAGEETAKGAPQSSEVDPFDSASRAGHVKSDSIGQDENFNVTSTLDATKYDEDAGDRRRLSASPQIPDIARMSTFAFGADLFSPSSGVLSAGRPMGETLDECSSHVETSKPEVVLTGSHCEDDVLVDGQTLAPNPFSENQNTTTSSQGGQDGSKSHKVCTAAQALPDVGRPAKDVVELDPDPEIHAIAPLRTPSPRATRRSMYEASLPEVAANLPPNDLSTEQAKPDSGIRFEPPSVQRQATFDTGASSPIKDSDMLSDEILKSLGPSAASTEAANGQFANRSVQPSGQIGISDSGATLKDQESCWEGSGNCRRSPETSATAPPVTEVPDRQDSMQTAASSTGNPAESLVSPQSSSSLRRRFSWEAEDRAAQAQNQKAPLLSTDDSTTSVDQDVDGNQQSLAASNDRSQHTSEAIDSAYDAPNAVGISSQSSSGSGLPPADQQSAPEAPEDTSLETENKRISVGDTNRSSLADEAMITQPDSDVALPTAPSEKPSAVTEQASPSPIGQQSQMMGFREIMNLSSSRERVAKYNESREMFSHTDGGLENWLAYMSAEYTDVTSNGPLLSAHGFQQSAAGSNTGPQAGPSNSVSPSPTSRSRLAGLSISNTASASTFGHSGNQIGTKGKELMHSAGKMGKGLLSKGRSKLRGTGDKVFH